MTYPDIQVVDEHDEIVGAAPFNEVYAKGLHHRISRIVVEDGQGNMLLQKRGPNVKLYPNTWDVAAAGHVDADEDYLIAAKRELAEEVGLKMDTLERLGKQEVHKVVDGRIINRFITVYRIEVDHNIAITAPPDEVTELKWFAIADIRKMIADQPEQLADGLTDTFKDFY